jgi:hypothetical protein
VTLANACVTDDNRADMGKTALPGRLTLTSAARQRFELF